MTPPAACLDDRTLPRLPPILPCHVNWPTCHLLEKSSAATRPKHPFTDRVTLTSREHPNSTSSHTPLSGQFKALECVLCTEWKTPGRIDREVILRAYLYLCNEKESWQKSVVSLDPFTEGVGSKRGNSVCLLSIFPSPIIFLLFLLRFSSPPLAVVGTVPAYSIEDDLS